MNSEHKVCLLGHAGGARDHLTDAPLEEVWATTCVLSAYDALLFQSGWPSEAWAAALQELLGARQRILAEVIPLRLRAYRAWSLPEQVSQVN